MTSRFGTWLAGGAAAPESGTNAANDSPEPDEADARYPGQRYGLPAAGVGSVAALWRRLVAFVIDCVFAALVTSLFVHPNVAHPQAANYWSVLTWFLITVIGIGFFAASPGMTLVGIRVARVDGAAYVWPLRAAVRSVLVAFVVPAVIWDVDRRGLHDKVAGTIVLSIR